MPGLDVAFLVIVTTSFRLSPVDGTVLICQSVLVTIFKSELSVTHLLALAHLASQSGPAWHVICAGFDNPASGPPPPAQLQAPKRTQAISEFRRTYLIAIPQHWVKTFARGRRAVKTSRGRLGQIAIEAPAGVTPRRTRAAGSGAEASEGCSIPARRHIARNSSASMTGLFACCPTASPPRRLAKLYLPSGVLQPGFETLGWAYSGGQL
jgi:hypothetical protein